MSSSLDYLDLCRLCLVKDRVSVPIFEDEGDVRQMFLKITACLPVKIAREDKLPKKICDDCVYKVELLYQFWNTTANAEKQLLQWLGEVGGLEDKQGYVTEVLDSSAMKQEQPSDNRLDGSIMQVRGHQNNMEMGMMNNMTLITMPTGSEQFTSVPMDTTGTVQTIPSGSSTQVTHDQIVQNQTAVGHMAEEESEEEDNSDEGCDNEEGLPVKEEAEEDPNDQSLEQTAFVNVPISCGEAGPSGLQQQKISEMSEMAMQPSNDVDPKSGTHAFCLQGHNNQFIWLSLNNNLQAQRSQIAQQQTTQNHQQSILLPQQQQSFLLPVQQRQQESIILSQNQQSLFLAQQQQPILLPQQQQRGRIILPQQPMFLRRKSQQPLLPRIPPPELPLSRLPPPGLTPLPLPPSQLPLTQPPPLQIPQSQLAPSQLQTSRLTTPRIPVPGLIPPQLPPPRLPPTTSIASSHLQQPLLFMEQPLTTQSLLFLRQTNEQQPLILLQQPQEQEDPILVLQPPQHQQECSMLQPQIEKKVDFTPTGRQKKRGQKKYKRKTSKLKYKSGRPRSLKVSTSNSISNCVYKIEDDQPIKEEHPLTQKNDVEFQETISNSQAPLFNSQDTSAEFKESDNFIEIKAHHLNEEDSRDIIDPQYMQDNYRSSEESPPKSVYLRVKSNKDLGLIEETMSDAHENTTSDMHGKNQCTEVQDIDDVSLEMRYRAYKKLRHIKVKSKRRTRTYTHSCEICGTSFSQENQLTEHMTKHSKVEDKKVVEPKQFYCDNCGYKSITLSRIRRHIQIKHNENYTYNCSICQECFKDRMEFFNHAKKHKLDPWFCDICGNVFESRPALYRHKNEVHQQNLHRLQCDKCFKKFNNMNNLESHVLLHMEMYVCDKCGKVFANRDYLTRHLYTHMDEKIHPCHMCKKRFKLKFSLHVHTLTHLGKKLYVCDVCNKSFTQRTPMMSHRRTQHPEVKDLPLPMPVKIAKLARKEQNRIAQNENEESDASDKSDDSDETDSYDESEESDDD